MSKHFENTASALKPLSALVATYEECLSLSRNFLASRQKAEEENEADAWEDFLSAREELFDFAEHSISDLNLNYPQPEEDPESAERQILTEKVLSVLGEMGEMEDQLAAFLGQSLEVLKATISSMQKSQPVFKHYGNLPPRDNYNLVDRNF